MSEEESVPAANGNEESNGKNKEESSTKEETNGKEETKDISDLEYNIIRQVEYYFSKLLIVASLHSLYRL